MVAGLPNVPDDPTLPRIQRHGARGAYAHRPDDPLPRFRTVYAYVRYLRRTTRWICLPLLSSFSGMCRLLRRPSRR